jgi:hypothetical protein
VYEYVQDLWEWVQSFEVLQVENDPPEFQQYTLDQDHDKRESNCDETNNIMNKI